MVVKKFKEFTQSQIDKICQLEQETYLSCERCPFRDIGRCIVAHATKEQLEKEVVLLGK